MEVIFARDVQVGQTVMVCEGREHTIERMKYDGEHLILFWSDGEKFFCVAPGTLLGLVRPAPQSSVAGSAVNARTEHPRFSPRPDPSKVLERDLRAFVLGMDNARQPAHRRGPRPNLDRYDRMYEG